MGGHAENPEQLIHRSEIEIEQQFPDGADDDTGNQDRQDEDGAIDQLPAVDTMAKQGEPEPQDHLAADRAGREDHGVEKTGPEEVVIRQRKIVGESDR